jgi:hypothetical protein
VRKLVGWSDEPLDRETALYANEKCTGSEPGTGNECGQRRAIEITKSDPNEACTHVRRMKTWSCVIASAFSRNQYAFLLLKMRITVMVMI